MTVKQLICKVETRLKDKDLSGENERIAIQFNLSDKPDDVMYIEILNGALSVMPYEYIDHDAVVTASADLLSDIMDGKESIMDAVTGNKVRVEGNVEKALLVATLIAN